MMVYRHIDLKKYINITIEKGLIIKTIILFTFAIVLYYQNNLYLNIINLLVVCIYAVIINKTILLSGYKIVLNKLKR